MSPKLTWLVAALLVCASCNEDKTLQPTVSLDNTDVSTGFVQHLAPGTGIDFANKITETAELNPFTFFNVYNGGGVAIADIDQDGLPDVYFTANQLENRLYRNKGGFQFEDITASAGVAGVGGWTTGVTTADVNADGLLDLYVCRSGPEGTAPADLQNLLYINNGDATFTESARLYGLIDEAQSNHAAFFDYDRDGDLDLYLVNHPLGFGDHIQTRLKKAQAPTNQESDRVFRNNGNGSFEDVTDAAGLRNYGFGLSISVADLDNDRVGFRAGWR